MNRDVCGVCWGAYDDEGHCECVPPETTHAEGCWSWGPRHYLCAYDRIKQFENEVRMLQEQNTELDRKLAEFEQRTLTDEVIAELWHKNGGYHHHFARAIERWLKGEK